MKPETRTALEESIEKWRAIVDGHGVDSSSNCALCHRFCRYPGKRCELGDEPCPVFKAKGIIRCVGTPFEDWEDYQVEHDAPFPRKIFDDKSRQLAQAELDFLKSLLPAEST